MGDLSVEPSMEEILSSIKRIIAEEGEAPGRGRRPAKAPPPAPAPSAADEVLELSDPMPATPAAAELTRRAQAIEAANAGRLASPPEPPAANWAAEPPRAPEEPPIRARANRVAEPTPEPAPTAPEQPIISPQTADASREALDSLQRLAAKSDGAGEVSLEATVRDMLRPLLRDWLDRNLPEMVETMVAREIARISAQRG